MVGLGGAGRGGGLLFLAVVAFVGYLAISALAGVARVVAGTIVVLAMVLLAVNVLGRR